MAGRQTNLCWAAGQQKRDTKATEDGTGTLAQAAHDVGLARQPPAHGRGRRDDEDRHAGVEDNRDQAERDELCGNAAPRGIDELRDDGEEKGRHLGVGCFHDDALTEGSQSIGTCSALLGKGRRGGRALGLDTEIDEV